MRRINLNAQGVRGLVFLKEADRLQTERFFGLPCTTRTGMPECSGDFLLITERGRFEGARLVTKEYAAEETVVRVVRETPGAEYRVETVYRLDQETGVITRSDALTNQTGEASTIYACLPRLTLQGGQYELYAQASNWSKENQGAWLPLSVGGVTLTNSAGRSTESGTPFACLRQMQTGIAVAIHVRPVGDWIIRVRRVAEGRATHYVLETGLSDQDLHMRIAPGETIDLPELLFLGFEGQVERCGERWQRYLLNRYGLRTLPEMVYNTWFFEFDTLDVPRLQQQVLRAKELGCRVFVVDAGWFGAGEDWSNQVGEWRECTTRAFRGRMREFADFVRSNGMGFGLWMEPERACQGTPVYVEHPDWFLDEDAIVFDLSNPAVREHLCGELTRLVEAYGLCWMKLDFNSNLFRDRTGSNYYRYYQAEAQLMAMIRERNPGCTFEGCASGGMRSDFHHCLDFYHGFFVSDTVHPIECLRIRQGIGLRMLPAYTGAWTVLHETPFSIGSYAVRNRTTRTKVLAAGDPWWHHTVDVTADFAVKLNLLGEWGLSGDLTSYSSHTVETMKKGISFYEAHRGFLGRSVCHLLTSIQPIHDETGWTALQFENVDGAGSLIFVFRMADDATDFVIYPKNLEMQRIYRVRIDDEDLEPLAGDVLFSEGILVQCASRYEGRIISIQPIV